MKKISYKFIMIIQAVILLLLLLYGVTGSSFPVLKSFAPFFSSNEEKIFGDDRLIRSDEYAVGTSLAIAQYNNLEYFPVLNKSLGVVGKHFSIAHDTGIPVAEPALLFKPATWGFFLFDLRRALSWYWLLPIFVSINGFFLLLQVYFKKQDFTNFLLSLALAFSFHSIGWSFWPSYQIGLASFATVFFILTFINKQKLKKIIYSLLFSLSAGSFILTLYLPRIIPVATFCLLILIGYFIKYKTYKCITENIPYLIFSLIFISGILLSWFYNNFDAIQAMLNSSYPGLRRIYCGDKTLWDEFSGWLNPILIEDSLGFKNQSEIATYCSFLLPICVLIYFARKKLDSIVIATIIFAIFSYCYLYFGIPEWLGTITFWNRTTPRAIIGIDLMQLFFFAWYYKNGTPSSQKKLNLVLAFVFLIIVTAVLHLQLPDELVGKIGGYQLYLSIAFLGLSYYFVLNKYKYFPIVFCSSLLYFTLTWHPLYIAPSKIVNRMPKKVLLDKDVLYGGKVVNATSNSIKSNIIAMLGVPIYNCTSHYTDPEIYNEFYKDLERSEDYNKFNHMLIIPTAEPTDHYESYGDVIVMKISGTNFDFKRFKADFVIINEQEKNLLENNKTVKHIKTAQGVSYYKIMHDK